MKAEFVIRNGNLIKSEEACISIYNKPFFFNFAVYSNVKVVKGRMFAPALEIEKLFESASKIGISCGFSKDDAMEWLRRLVSANKIGNALIRMLLVGGDENTKPAFFMFPVGLTFYPKKMYSKGAKVITYEGERLFPQSKTQCLLLNYMAYREASKKGAIDAILVDREGNMREGTRTSLFAIKGGFLIAPPDEDVLEGLTRKLVLEIAPKLMRVKKEKIRKDGNYDGFFITSTTIGIMPICEIDEKRTDFDKEKIKALQDAYKEYCKDKWVS